MLATVYSVNIATINEHIIYKDNELEENSTIRNFQIVQKEGSREVSREMHTILTEKYFEEQLERIREIRMSERKFYQKITYIIEQIIQNVLKDNWKISAEMAKLHAETEFEKYRIIQDRIYKSYFDELLLKSSEMKKEN